MSTRLAFKLAAETSSPFSSKVFLSDVCKTLSTGAKPVSVKTFLPFSCNSFKAPPPTFACLTAWDKAAVLHAPLYALNYSASSGKALG